MLTKESDYDVVVVGARCAGATTAMVCAQAGLRVLVLDRGEFGSDTLSTHALMRPGLLVLERLGVLNDVREAGTPKIRATEFHYGEGADVNVIEVPNRAADGVDALYAPRRTVVDRLLVQAAERAGAEFNYGWTVTEVLGGRAGRVVGVIAKNSRGERRTIRAGRVVGADGSRSTVAQLVKAPTLYQGEHAAACVYGYYEANKGLDRNRWHFANRFTAGATPTNHGEMCVFLCFKRELMRDYQGAHGASAFEAKLREIAPNLIGCAHRTSRLFSFAGIRGFIREAAGPGWALAGDAGCFKDPATAHGMSDALRDGLMLGIAIASGRDEAVERYADERVQHVRRFVEVTDRIASLDWTLEEAQTLHREMAAIMRAECDSIAAAPIPPNYALAG